MDVCSQWVGEYFHSIDNAYAQDKREYMHRSALLQKKTSRVDEDICELQNVLGRVVETINDTNPADPASAFVQSLLVEALALMENINTSSQVCSANYQYHDGLICHPFRHAAISDPRVRKVVGRVTNTETLVEWFQDTELAIALTWPEVPEWVHVDVELPNHFILSVGDKIVIERSQVLFVWRDSQYHHKTALEPSSIVLAFPLEELEAAFKTYTSGGENEQILSICQQLLDGIE